MGRYHDHDSGKNILVGFSFAAIGSGIIITLLTGQWLIWLPIVAAIYTLVKVFHLLQD